MRSFKARPVCLGAFSFISFKLPQLKQKKQARWSTTLRPFAMADSDIYERKPATGARRLILFTRADMGTSKKLFVKTRFPVTSRYGRWPVLLLLYTFALLFVFNLMASVSNGKKIKSHAERSISMAVSALRSRLDWDAIGLPELCHQIVRKPQPLRKNCSTAPKVKGAPRCDPNHPMMFSQYGEDYYLYTRHFSKYKKPGVYLDIATNE